jgi:DNA-binding NarL/FixJ family response regulator
MVPMKKIKVMLASRPKILSDVIRSIIEHQLDMVIVGSVIDPIKLIFAIRETAVDVVIMSPIKANGEPIICMHLLAEQPLLKIVTQSATGDAAYLYQTGMAKRRLDDPSAQSILHAIREALQPAVN